MKLTILVRCRTLSNINLTGNFKTFFHRQGKFSKQTSRINDYLLLYIALSLAIHCEVTDVYRSTSTTTWRNISHYGEKMFVRWHWWH
jgi:hypothetical protein